MPKNRFPDCHSRCVTTILFAFLLSVHTSGYASWLVENDVAIGVEAGNLNSGISLKIPYSSDSSWQLTVGTGSAVNSIGGRYLAHFSEWNDARVYWYGGVSAWFWSGNAFFGSETALGVSGGIGWDYDLTNLENFTAPISLNLTMGPSYAAFSNYSGLDLLNIGLGIHYRFK